MQQNPSDPVNPDNAFSSPLPPPPGGQGALPPIPPPLPPGRGPAANPPPGAPAFTPYPPMMFPPPPKPRHSFARGILVTLATTIFSISLMLNIYLLFLGGIMSGGGGSRLTVISPGDSSQRVVVIPVHGVIMDRSQEAFDRMMQRADKDDDLKALVIEVDTPGGSVTASDMIHHRIEQYRAKHPAIPVTVSMQSMATSGGYYVACAAPYIFAQRTTMTGNIGVLLPKYNISELAKKLGVEETTVSSTGAVFKNAGSMFRPESPAEARYFQELIDGAFDTFKLVIRNGRSSKLTKPLDEIANGKVYMADEALKLGLIDQIGYLDDATSYAATTAGLSKPQVVRYDENPSLSQLLFGAESKSSVRAPAISVQVSSDVIENFLTPRLMYLWRGE